MLCVYCGEKADTREHAPSKVLLEHPYPNNLPVLPSCKRCNNSFSSDELYMALLLELLKFHYYDGYYKLSDKTLSRFDKKEGQQAIKDSQQYILNLLEIINNSKILRVIHKLAICHAVYEMSEGYHGDDYISNQQTVSFKLLPMMRPDEYDDWDCVEPLEGKMLPEIGSIGYDRIGVIELPLYDVSGELGKKIMFSFIDWHDVQEDRYRYICFKDGNMITVKIVINEFLFGVINFYDELASILRYQ